MTGIPELWPVVWLGRVFLRGPRMLDRLAVEAVFPFVVVSSRACHFLAVLPKSNRTSCVLFAYDYDDDDARYCYQRVPPELFHSYVETLSALSTLSSVPWTETACPSVSVRLEPCLIGGVYHRKIQATNQCESINRLSAHTERSQSL